MATPVEVIPVALENRKEIKRFIKFHYRVYENYPNWIAPLIIDYLDRLNPKKNAYMHHSKVQPFLALRDGEVVGRLTAHENTQHVKFHNEPVGFFGFFESINDQSVADALFETAGAWLSDRGLSTMRGPMSLSVNGDPVGFLVEGFDSEPVVLMPYNPEYYLTLIENAGFSGVQDLYAYDFPSNGEIPDHVRRVAERALQDPRLTVRKPNMKRYYEEFEELKFLYNEALSKNWGAVPMTDIEFEHFAKEMKLAIDPEVSFIAEYDGVPVGLSLVFFDMNQAIKYTNGRLLPFGLIKLLIKKRSIQSAKLPVLGVLENYRMKGIDAVFYYKSIIEGYKRGYRRAELSWVLADNRAMVNTLKHLGLTVSKTYRLYDRSIG